MSWLGLWSLNCDVAGVAICQTLPPPIARKLTQLAKFKRKKGSRGPVCLSVKSSDSPGSQDLHLHARVASFLRAGPTCVLTETLSIIALMAECLDGSSAGGSRGRGMDGMTSDRLPTPFNWWLHWVFRVAHGLFGAAHRLSLVAGGESALQFQSMCSSLPWLLLLQGTGSRAIGSVAVAHGFSRPACWIFLDQGSNSRPLNNHWTTREVPQVFFFLKATLLKYNWHTHKKTAYI